MKRNSLTTAVIAGLAGVAGMTNMASAMDLNPDGLGQVLIYPYYTVNQGNQTLISVVNTTASAKAVKVRFVEGHNSREVLDFNLFLSPFDVWTAAVFSLSDTGSGNVVTNDNSCTAPFIKGSAGLPSLPDGRKYAPFRNGQFSGANEDTGPTTLDRTREGHMEIIEMATLQGATATAVTHVSGVVSTANCNSVQQLSLTSTNLLPPSGGLFGAGSVVNAAIGTLLGYNADAIDGFYQVTGANLFSAAGSLQPSLASAATTPTTAVSFVFNNGNLITSTYPLTTAPSQAIDAVSALFTAQAIYNEYELEAGAGAESEWVVTFPTKRFYVDPQVIGAAATSAIQPFVEVFGVEADDQSCVIIDLTIYNREEQTTTTQIDFSPLPSTPPSSLCFEAQVISFEKSADYVTRAGRSIVLGSKLTTNIDARGLGFDAGWLRLGLGGGVQAHTLRASTDGDVFSGLPVTGFLATNFINSNVTAGVLSNYSGLYRHRASRACTNGVGACS